MIKKGCFILALGSCLNACTPESGKPQATEGTDTIYHHKKVVVYETETVRVIKQPVMVTENEKTIIPGHSKVNPKPSKKMTSPTLIPAVVQLPRDTQYFYYKRIKKIAVKISPWDNGRRSILLFDMDGKLTYTFHDKNFSFTETTTLNFHSSGAVSVASTHLNPGASMYWYETETTFSETNIPLTRVSEQMPREHLEMPQKEYWDIKNEKWVKQLTMECQPPMKN